MTGITDKFGMNFTSVRLAGTELWVHGETPSDIAVSEVEAIHVAVFRRGEKQDDAPAASMLEPELVWSTRFAQPSPYMLGDQVFVVGIAVLRGKPPHAWSNVVTVIGDTTLGPRSAPPAAGP